MLPLRARVMAKNEYSAFPKVATSREPHHQIVLCHKQDTHWEEGLTLLQSQPFGQTEAKQRKVWLILWSVSIEEEQIPLAIWVHVQKLVIIIIIILSSNQHGYPWPSLVTRPHCSSLPVGPLGYTPYPHRAAVCRCELVALSLLGHVKGSIGVHHLWAR